MLPVRPTVAVARRVPRGRWGAWWALLALWLCTPPAAATHLMGSDWQFEAVGGERFRLRLTLYLDLSGGGAESFGDPSVTVAAYERSAGAGQLPRLMDSFILPRVASGPLPGAAANCQGIGVPTNRLVYEAFVEMAVGRYPQPAGYYFVYDRCCRNDRLTNVRQPLGVSAAPFCVFGALQTSGPTGLPAFREAPPATAFCLGQALSLSLAASVAGADSLTYELVPGVEGLTSSNQPVAGIPQPPLFRSVSYTTGFSAQNPLPGAFQLNRRTGLLTGNPTQLGVFLVAVRCVAWRQGQPWAENYRELEVATANCPANAAPTLTASGFDPTDTLEVSNAQSACFQVVVDDPDPGQTLQVRAVPNPGVRISPAQITVGFPAAPSTIDVCWRDCRRAFRGELVLVVTDDGCRRTRPDTLRLPIRVVPPANRPPTLRRLPPAPDTLEVAAGAEVKFDLEAIDPEGDSLTVRVLPATGPQSVAGLTAAPLAGRGQVAVQVRWRPDCAAANRAPYVLAFTVTDGGCAPADTVRVPVRVVAAAGPGAGELTNIITPNGDGRNDCFGWPTVAGGACSAVGFELRIYSRWGRQVFLTTDPQACWDGDGLAAGPYYYLLRGSAGDRRGLLTIIR